MISRPLGSGAVHRVVQCADGAHISRGTAAAGGPGGGGGRGDGRGRSHAAPPDPGPAEEGSAEHCEGGQRAAEAVGAGELTRGVREAFFYFLLLC